MDNQWIVEATINQLQAAMMEGRLTAKELVLFYLQRIASYDKNGPKINAILEVNPDAVHIAEALDAERAAKGPRGPLHGIPVLLKDNIDTGDNMHTSAGSLALADSYAAEDSFVAKRLRNAGAVILGKTNLTEFANFVSENMPNGYSSRGGQVLNPYGPGIFDVEGSSSGSAAAVAANFAAAAIGTETSGSILSPSSANSIVGIKPTVGLISRTGIIPIAFSQDTAGPMARTVADAALLLGVLTGYDEADPATGGSVGRAHTDYTPFLDPNGLRGARIGIARPVYFDQLRDDQAALMNAAIEVLRREGAVVFDPVAIPTATEKWDNTVLLYEFKPALNAYLSRLPAHWPIRSLRDVIRFNRQYREEALRYGQKMLEKAEETSGTLTEPVYLQTRASDLQKSQAEGIDNVMRAHRLDALLFPACLGADIAAKAGYPSITVPGGYTPEGEPLGVTFTGMAYSEPTLIRIAYAFEQATNHRVPPPLS
jgi:amidase